MMNLLQSMYQHFLKLIKQIILTKKSLFIFIFPELNKTIVEDQHQI